MTGIGRFLMMEYIPMNEMSAILFMFHRKLKTCGETKIVAEVA
jgi:hypothetical protein